MTSEWFAMNIHHLHFIVQGLVALYFVTFVIPVGIVIYQAPSTPVPVTSSTNFRASMSPIKTSSTEFPQDDIHIPRPVIPVYIGYDEQSPKNPPVHIPDTPLPRSIALTAVHLSVTTVKRTQCRFLPTLKLSQRNRGLLSEADFASLLQASFLGRWVFAGCFGDQETCRVTTAGTLLV